MPGHYPFYAAQLVLARHAPITSGGNTFPRNLPGSTISDRENALKTEHVARRASPEEA